MYGPEGTSRGVHLPRLPDNDVGGTFFGAPAAAGAERLVDVGDVVFQGDGAGRAVLLTFTNSDRNEQPMQPASHISRTFRPFSWEKQRTI